MATHKPKKKRELVAKFPDSPDPEKANAAAKAVLSASVNAAAVAVEYAKAPFGEQDIGALVERLSTSIQEVWDGDTKRIEAMLYGQASALQAIFTNLARRSIAQEYLKQMDAHLRLALKAQSQCRATLETLATIKAGPAIFARQANIAHGPQQVNNGISTPIRAGARAGETETVQTELLTSRPGGPSIGERDGVLIQPIASRPR
jgi:hypothetical protein